MKGRSTHYNLLKRGFKPTIRSRLHRKIREEKAKLLPPPFIKPKGWTRPPGTEISLHRRIRQKAVRQKIFPDVLPESFIPTLHLKVEYPQSETPSTNVVVRKGNKLRPSLLEGQPTVSFPSKGSSMWTLAMTTPDDPLQETLPPSQGGHRGSEFLHWLVTNIPGDDIASGDELASYVPPLPAMRGDMHRYAFVLFEQPNGQTPFDQDFLRFDEMGSRACFNTFLLQSEYGLTPRGLAFFNSQWKEDIFQKHYEAHGLYVPELAHATSVAKDLWRSRQYRGVYEW